MTYKVSCFWLLSLWHRQLWHRPGRSFDPVISYQATESLIYHPGFLKYEVPGTIAQLRPCV